MHSIKLPEASSCVMWTQANTPVFREPPLLSSTRNRTPLNSSPAYLYTRPNPWLVVGGEPHECLWEKSSAPFAWFCFVFSLLCTGSQCRRKAKPPSLSQSAFHLIKMAPFARWSTYRCDDLPWCYFLAIVEFSGWSAQRAFGVLCTSPRFFFRSVQYTLFCNPIYTRCSVFVWFLNAGGTDNTMFCCVYQSRLLRTGRVEVELLFVNLLCLLTTSVEANQCRVQWFLWY